MRRTALAGMVVLAVGAGCSDERGPNISGLDDYAITRVVVQPTVDTILISEKVTPSDQVTMRAVAMSRVGSPINNLRYVWTSSDPSVAVVDTGGVVRAVGLGTAEISASAAKIGKATVAVMPVVARVSASSPATQVLAGDTIQLVARAFDYADAPMARSFAWRSSAPNVATVDSLTGRVIFRSTGSATFTASSAFRSGTVTVTALSRALLSVDVGGDVACGLTALGRGYCWGAEGAGKLASSADSSCASDAYAAGGACTLEPKRIVSPAIDFRVVSAGGTFGCGVSAQQMLFCWGDGTFGQIGWGRLGSSPIPALATVGSERFTTVTAGEAHACALNLTGLAYCWGLDELGQLGDNRRVNSTTPIPVVGENGQPSSAIRFTRISAGANHTCAIDAGGAAYCWGVGLRGALGIGSRIASDVPARVSSNESFREISAGRDHSCAVTTGGNMYCWGGNGLGQLGTDTTVVQRLTPVLVGSGYTAVSAGDSFTCALTTAGDVRCWGWNGYGQLGRGEGSVSFNDFHVSPATVTGGHRFTSVSAGWRHACGLASDGNTYCWGSNMMGALGNQLQAALRTSPVRVATPR